MEKLKVDFSDLKEVFERLLEEKEKIDNEWSLTITREFNGYTLKGQSEEGAPITFVIEDDPKDELKSHENLLWEIMDYFTFGGSKHDKEQIQIERRKNK